MKYQNDVAYKSPHDPPERQGGRLLNLGIICLSGGKGTTTTHIAVAPKKPDHPPPCNFLNDRQDTFQRSYLCLVDTIAGCLCGFFIRTFR